MASQPASQPVRQVPPVDLLAYFCQGGNQPSSISISSSPGQVQGYWSCTVQNEMGRPGRQRARAASRRQRLPCRRSRALHVANRWISHVGCRLGGGFRASMLRIRRRGIADDTLISICPHWLLQVMLRCFFSSALSRQSPAKHKHTLARLAR